MYSLFMEEEAFAFFTRFEQDLTCSGQTWLSRKIPEEHEQQNCACCSTRSAPLAHRDNVFGLSAVQKDLGEQPPGN